MISYLSITSEIIILIIFYYLMCDPFLGGIDVQIVTKFKFSAKLFGKSTNSFLTCLAKVTNVKLATNLKDIQRRDHGFPVK